MASNFDLNKARKHPDVLRNSKIGTIIKSLRRLLVALGGKYVESDDTDVVLVDKIAELAEKGKISPAVVSAGKIWYATCSTASGTGAKTATTSTGDFVLATGSMVRVKFTTSNTAANPTISIDGSTAKTIQPKSGTSGMANLIAAGEVVDLVYDGTNFIMTKGSSATTTFYGITKLNSSTSSTSTTEAATPSAVKDVADAKVDRAGDTMTGNLAIGKSGDTYVVVQDTDTQCRLMMDSYTSGTHGLWSSGYYDGSNYHADGVWLIRRKPDNEVVVDGNCTGTADNVTGTVAIANGGTGATDAASALAALGGCPIVTTDISANSSATFTLSNSGRGVLVLIGAAVKGVYLVNATSSGGISYSSVLAATGATLNTSTNNRLTVSVTGFVTAAMLTISGTIGLV